MKPLRTTADLIALAAANAPSAACAQSLLERGASVLSGINSGQGFPGWFIECESRAGKRWRMGVFVNEALRRYEVEFYR
jgi:hypothetical protein